MRSHLPVRNFESDNDSTGAIPVDADYQNTQDFLASGAIAALDVCSLDVSKSDHDRARYVKEQDTSAPDVNLMVGIAKRAAADGEKVELYQSGSYVEDVPYTGTVLAAGVLLTASTATAGALMPHTAANLEQVFAVSLEAGASGTVDIYIF